MMVVLYRCVKYVKEKEKENDFKGRSGNLVN